MGFQVYLLVCLLIPLSVGLDIAWLAPETLHEETMVTSAVGGMALAINKITADTSILDGETFRWFRQMSLCNFSDFQAVQAKVLCHLSKSVHLYQMIFAEKQSH